MLDCREADALAAAGNCNWGSLSATNATQTATSANVGYTDSFSGLSAGFQRVIGDGRTVVGAALRDGTSALGSAGGQSLTGNTLSAGLLAKRAVSRTATLSANVIGGTVNYTSDRFAGINGPTAAQGGQRTSYLAAHLRADARLGNAALAVKPFIDAGAMHVSSGALNESGAGGLDTIVAPHGDSWCRANGVRERPHCARPWGFRSRNSSATRGRPRLQPSAMLRRVSRRSRSSTPSIARAST
jgi:hypothetical protein